MSGSEPREWRVAFELNGAAPRGPGVYHTDPTSRVDAESRFRTIKGQYERDIRERGESGYERFWLESRRVGPWEQEANGER